jgi:hypothetical protein
VLKKHSIQPYVIIMHSKYFNIFIIWIWGGETLWVQSPRCLSVCSTYMQYTNKYSSICFILKAFPTFIMNYIIYIILLYAFLVLSVVGSVGRSVGSSDYWPTEVRSVQYSDRINSRFGSVGRIFTSDHPCYNTTGKIAK